MSNCRSVRKKKRYSEFEMPDEMLEQLKVYEKEVEGMELRPIRCPRCHKIIQYAYDDNRTGHVGLHCDRCKLNYVIPLSHFHTRRNKRRPWNSRYLKDN